MIKSIQNRNYDLYFNGKKLNIEVSRVKGFKEFISKVIRKKDMEMKKGFFIYNEKNIATFGLSEKIDLVWVDWEGKVIKIKENFEVNKVSKSYDNTKFIYIFAQKTIARKKIINNGLLKHEFNRQKKK